MVSQKAIAALAFLATPGQQGLNRAITTSSCTGQMCTSCTKDVTDVFLCSASQMCRPFPEGICLICSCLQWCWVHSLLMQVIPALQHYQAIFLNAQPVIHSHNLRFLFPVLLPIDMEKLLTLQQLSQTWKLDSSYLDNPTLFNPLHMDYGFVDFCLFSFFPWNSVTVSYFSWCIMAKTVYITAAEILVMSWK